MTLISKYIWGHCLINQTTIKPYLCASLLDLPCSFSLICQKRLQSVYNKMLQTAHKFVQSQDYLSAHVYEYTIETTLEEAKHKQAWPHPCSPERRSGRHCHISDESLQKPQRECYTSSQPLIFKYINLVCNTPRAINADVKVLRNANVCVLRSHLSNWPRGNSESDSSGCRNTLNGFLWAVGPSANSSKWALFLLLSLLRITFAVKSI